MLTLVLALLLPNPSTTDPLFGGWTTRAVRTAKRGYFPFHPEPPGMLLLTNMDYVRECTIKDDYGGSLRFWCLQKARTGVCCEKGE